MYVAERRGEEKEKEEKEKERDRDGEKEKERGYRDVVGGVEGSGGG